MSWKRILSTASDGFSRRQFVRGAGVLLALPVLEWTAENSSAATAAHLHPQRLLMISNNLGILPDHFFPTAAGQEYKLSPYLTELSKFRNKFTVFSGLSHPACEGGHSTENCFLTGARHPTSSGFRNTISLDQFAAEQLGRKTRFSNLNLGVNIVKFKRSLSWTRDGVLLPAEDSPTRLFKKMFFQGTKAETQLRLHQLKRRGSILDAVSESTRSLRHQLGRNDKARLAQYLSSIRELEKRLHVAGQWEQRPKPKSDHKPSADVVDRALLFDKFDQMLTMATLALQSDSTRIVTLMVDAFETPAFQINAKEKSSQSYHGLSHHGKRRNFLAQLEKTDRRQMAILKKLLTSLDNIKVESGTLLDRSMVLYGSNMGDANTHTNTNLPILLAGGGLKHGQHLSFDRENNTPLCNLYVSMLQRLGIESDRFSSATGRLTGLDIRT